VTNAGSGTVSVIDTATNTVTATIAVGTDPAGVAVDPAAGTVYVPNSTAGTASVIDTATNTVTATIAVGTEPAEVAVDPSTHSAYVTSTTDGTVSVIDTATNAVTGTIAVGTEPAGVAVDPAAGTVYVDNDSAGTVSVIDTATSTVTGTIAVGTEPAGVAVDPSTHIAYVTNFGNGTVSLLSAALPAPVPTALTARIHRGPHYRFTLIARLTASGHPVSGQHVSFRAGHTHLCTPRTNTHGVASCVLTASQTLLVEHDHDTVFARYLGNTSYLPSATLAAPQWRRRSLASWSLDRSSPQRSAC
jgi:YVTN family beta-propeller protein